MKNNKIPQEKEMTWKELCMLLLGILIGFSWFTIWRMFNLI